MTLYSCDGGNIVLPGRGSVLVSRMDGGHLIVNPSRDVWERSELTRRELLQWSALVAAAGRAMLDVLPQLEGGCINYWEAGNWSLHDDAEPQGPKTARAFRKVHQHLLGRSPRATHPSWAWGEAPQFPRFAERLAWAAAFDPLTSEECAAIVTRVESLLRDVYAPD